MDTPPSVFIVVTDGCVHGYQVNDAYAVHDQMLWLPIGLAYAH